MIEKFIQDYFTFTKKERTAVIALLATLIVIFSLPRFFPDKEPKVSLKDLEAFRASESAPARVSRFAEDSSGETDVAGFKEKRYEEKKIPAKRFRFDPNTLDALGWQSLGVREKTITTIQHYLAKGGQFRRPEDLSKVYGLNAELVGELMPYVTIKTREPPVNAAGFHFDSAQNYKYGNRKNGQLNTSGFQQSQGHFGFSKARRTPRTIPITDIATADSLSLVNLPGIGPRLAIRIINFREKLGGFYAVDQLSETFGLPDSTFRMLKPFLSVSNGKIQKVTLNSSSVEALKSHPYIRWNLANAIIAYRTEHGPFKEIADLNRIALVTPEVFAKLSPYLDL